MRRKFAERFTSPDARSDVNYAAFLAAVDMAAAGHDKVRPHVRVAQQHFGLFARTPTSVRERREAK